MRRAEAVPRCCGYYNRFDVFDLKVTRKRLSPIQFLDVAAPIDDLPDQAD